MKTIGDLKRDIEHLPDDTPICESCNYELVDLRILGEKSGWYCPNEMCLEEKNPVTR
ncbi:hypothetical protein LCGC14_0476930 [marine sediment metagenome]|uniref:Uncharacterized protein n=1 Tax=marine sediment metagenome TaxID=412755 RepID=A0A0F9UXG3_9ZZZZ